MSMSSPKSNSVGPDAVAPRRVTNSFTERTTRLERALTNPGAVKINVKGAFIVDEESRSKSPASSSDGVHYESQDIRLPHHTGLVSHVAVDVSAISFFPRFPAESSPRNHEQKMSTTRIHLNGKEIYLTFHFCKIYRLEARSRSSYILPGNWTLLTTVVA
jgi:hypothetical protein